MKRPAKRLSYYTRSGDDDFGQNRGVPRLRQPPAILHPLGNLATIRRAAAWRAMLAEIDVLAVDRDDGLTGRLVESIARCALGRTEIRHGATFVNPKNGRLT